MIHQLAWVALFAASAVAKQCRNMTIPVFASGRNGVFNVPNPQNQIDISNFFLNIARPGLNTSAEVLTGYQTVSGTYNISGTYCDPDSGPSNVLQILIPGLAFSGAYYDYGFNNFNYSYTAVAVDQYGYSTFAYDQIGTGNSSYPDPLNDVQGDLHVGVLKAVTDRLRFGTIPGIGRFSKIVHVGHSLGAAVLYALTARYPNITDGVVLTAFAQNATYLPAATLTTDFAIANTVAPRFANLQNCYITESFPTGSIQVLLAPDQWDPTLVPYLFENNQPLTCGIRLTILSLAGTLNNYKGPVQIVTGDRDLIFCGGNCTTAPAPGFPTIPSTSALYMPNVTSLDVEVIPGAGNALFLHYSASYTFGKILGFLAKSGLSPSKGRI